ncbi:bestrophin family protein [Pedobacter miscanthi]|uniref:Multidrug transporter n=1 Tax=Pedobacter miscanthi TaxID=2259170 RepID=A0A366KYP4_9SPHI|nr:bestrophin family ion channel [Pedobacter miscanthi]RBQ06761.1 multidrug transporter [Pedobacter miscanthi]
MYIGKSYRLSEFLIWTRKSIYRLLLLGTIPVILYVLFDIKWIAIPWTVVALLGTATAFIVGFKNTQTYGRTADAQHVWTHIINSSRSWALIVRDFLNNPEKTKSLIYRHFAWLTILRFQLRESREWESTNKSHNEEYQKYYTIPERESEIEAELKKYLPPSELEYILSKKNPAVQLLGLQSKAVRELFQSEEIVLLQFTEIQKAVREFVNCQGRCEEIKDSPYPRQYAIINTFLVKLFCFMLPFGMLKELDKLNESVEGLMKGNMVWLAVPFSVLISWMYTALGQVGESTENPFEGSANDVPISQFCEIIEIDLREMLDEKDIPVLTPAKHDIIL